MKKTDKQKENDELREEYDLSQMQDGVRGKYAERYKKGSNVVVLAPDVLEAFPTAEAVNDALRMLIKVAESTRRAS